MGVWHSVGLSEAIYSVRYFIHSSPGSTRPDGVSLCLRCSDKPAQADFDFSKFWHLGSPQSRILVGSVSRKGLLPVSEMVLSHHVDGIKGKAALSQGHTPIHPGGCDP